MKYISSFGISDFLSRCGFLGLGFFSFAELLYFLIGGCSFFCFFVFMWFATSGDRSLWWYVMCRRILFSHCCHYISHCFVSICFGDLLGALLGVLHFGLRGPFRFLRPRSGAYWFSSRQTGFLYGMFVFSWHLPGLIFRVRGSVGQMVDFFCVFAFLPLSPLRSHLIRTPLGDYFYH